MIFFFFFGGGGVPCRTAYGILVPPPGLKPVPPAVEAQSPNHWAAREVLKCLIFRMRRNKGRRFPQKRLYCKHSLLTQKSCFFGLYVEYINKVMMLCLSFY